MPELSWPKAKLLTQLEAHTHTHIIFYANDIKDFVAKICHNDCIIIITMLLAYMAGPGQGTWRIFDFIEHLIGISKHCQIANSHCRIMANRWSSPRAPLPKSVYCSPPSLSLSLLLSLLFLPPLFSLKAYITFNLIAAYVQALKWPWKHIEQRPIKGSFINFNTNSSVYVCRKAARAEQGRGTEVSHSWAAARTKARATTKWPISTYVHKQKQSMARGERQQRQATKLSQMILFRM